MAKRRKLDPIFSGIDKKMTSALKAKITRDQKQREKNNQIHQEGYNLGFMQGAHKGKQEAERRACTDLCEVWSQVQQHAQAASNYALAISEMYKGRLGAQTVAQTVQRSRDEERS